MSYRSLIDRNLVEYYYINAGPTGNFPPLKSGSWTSRLTGFIESKHADVDMDDQSAIKAITALRGFGPWSAEIYLMFSLQRSDIFPAGDLALRIALQRLKGIDEVLDEKQARALVEPWSPYRSAGSLFLWHYYRGAPT